MTDAKRDTARPEPDLAAPEIAFAGPRPLATALERRGFRLLTLPERGASADPGRTIPRLVLVAEEDADHATVTARIEAARRRWPLVDTLVFAPSASAARVREWLRAGAGDVLLEPDESALADALVRTLEAQQILPLVDRLADRRVRSSRFEGLLSRSHAMWDVFEMCARVAPTNANVLICGETGTGKELLARALHRRSKRTGRFAAVNCSSLPENLIESELFGHEKGAFTGATRARPGIFRHAEGGTVFLDEIGDMPASAQQSLLRVLEERIVRPVGGGDEIPIDVRIVAATHVDLDEAVAQGTFREDLLYRLDVIRLEIPPLRERPEDVVYLFGFFLKSLARHYDVERPKASDGFLSRVGAHGWPGNVRELENFAERVVLAGKPRLERGDFGRFARPADADDIDESATDAAANEASSATPIDPERRSLAEAVEPVVREVERRYLEAVLQATDGRVQEAARRAGISRRTLHRKLAALGIDKNRFRRS